jgi:hypothetical protein
MKELEYKLSENFKLELQFKILEAKNKNNANIHNKIDGDKIDIHDDNFDGFEDDKNTENDDFIKIIDKMCDKGPGKTAQSSVLYKLYLKNSPKK